MTLNSPEARPKGDRASGRRDDDHHLVEVNGGLQRRGACGSSATPLPAVLQLDDRTAFRATAIDVGATSPLGRGRLSSGSTSAALVAACDRRQRAQQQTDISTK
jgi:hypothetical protein